MEDQSLIKIGTINKTFGLKGHLRGFIEPEFIERIKKNVTIFLYSKKTPLPYFPDEFDLTASGHFLVHFEDVKDKTAADALVGKALFVEETSLKKKKKFQTPADYIGFQLIDKSAGEIGVLQNYFELPKHEIGQFIFKGKEIMFPWNEEVVLKIDTKKKVITVQLPEGLIDVYL